MIPELGHFTLILALALAILQCLLPGFGLYRNCENFMLAARPLCYGQCFFIFLSFMLLAFSFYENDFSLKYVVEHSNSTLPLFYKISAVWGGHEGSLLLWVLILGLWMVAVSLSSRKLALPFTSLMLSTLSVVSIGFLVFLLTTSNPFTRFLPDFPLEGRDLNPLLQDPGLIIHPPMLYVGYVGFAVPFAFAVASLILGRIDEKTVKWIRPFTLIAFSFLTIGIALGSWWAYYELGWGGYWFWDPVENASFLPWLVAIAMLHTLIVNDKRKEQYIFTILLAIICFGLSLLGTFLMRSGLLSSVHSFASDPKRGLLMLQFLLLLVGGAFILFGCQVSTLDKTLDKSVRPNSRLDTLATLSRENLILFIAILICITAAAVLLGTLFPILYEMITSKKIAVDFHYFNAVFIPLIIPILIAVPLGPFTHWGSNKVSAVLSHLKVAFILSVILALFLLLLPRLMTEAITEPMTSSISFDVIGKKFEELLGLFLGLWLCFGTLQRLIFKIRKQGIKNLSLGAIGMCLAHFGVGVMVLGVTVVSHYQIEREVNMLPGSSLAIANYRIKFMKVDKVEGSNFVGYRGHFEVEEGKKAENESSRNKIADLYPEKRVFVTPGVMMTETAIDPGFFRDIYIALGERLEHGTWSVRIHYKPLVRWIWLGAILIAIGAVIAALGKVYKKH